MKDRWLTLMWVSLFLIVGITFCYKAYITHKTEAYQSCIRTTETNCNEILKLTQGE